MGLSLSKNVIETYFQNITANVTATKNEVFH